MGFLLAFAGRGMIDTLKAKFGSIKSYHSLFLTQHLSPHAVMPQRALWLAIEGKPRRWKPVQQSIACPLICLFARSLTHSLRSSWELHSYIYTSVHWMPQFHIQFQPWPYRLFCRSLLLVPTMSTSLSIEFGQHTGRPKLSVGLAPPAYISCLHSLLAREITRDSASIQPLCNHENRV